MPMYQAHSRDFKCKCHAAAGLSVQHYYVVTLPGAEFNSASF